MHKPTYDIRQLIGFTGIHDPDELFILLNAFRKDIPSIVVEMETAIQKYNFETLKKLAHGAKGVTDSFAADQLAAHLRQMESAAQSENQKECINLFSIIFREVHLIFQTIHDYLIQHELYKKLNVARYSFLLIDEDRGSQIAAKKQFQKIGVSEIEIVPSTDEGVLFLTDNNQYNTITIIGDSIQNKDVLNIVKNIRTGQKGLRPDNRIVLMVNEFEPYPWEAFMRLDINGIALAPLKYKTVLQRILNLDIIITSREVWLQSNGQYDNISIQPQSVTMRKKFLSQIVPLNSTSFFQDNLPTDSDSTVIPIGKEMTMNRLRLYYQIQKLSGC